MVKLHLNFDSSIVKVFLGGFVAAGFGFLASLIMARTLSIEEFGRISLVINLSIISFTILEFGLGNALVVFVNRGEELGRRLGIFKLVIFKYLTVFLILSLLLSGLFGLIFELNILELSVIFVSSICFFIHKLFLSVNQAVGNWDKFNILQAGNTFTKLLCLALAFLIVFVFEGLSWLYESYLIALLIYGIAILIVGVIITETKVYKAIKLTEGTFQELKEIVVPIGLANCFIIIALRFDLLLVAYFLDEKSVGLYHAANTLAMIFPLVTKALMSVALRESAMNEKSKLLSSIKKQNKLILWLFLAVGIVFGSSDFLISFVYGEVYSESATLFVLLTIGYIGGIYFIPLESYFYSHNRRNLLVSKILVAVIMLVLGGVLVFQYQGLGVALSVVVSKAAGWCVIGYFIFREVKLGRFNDKQLG